jgi:hypothetical protein
MDLHNDDLTKIDFLFDSDGNLIDEPIPEDEWDFPDAQEFIAWLCQQAGRDDSVGDLASDLVADAGPGYTPTYTQLLCGVRRGDPGAEQALKAALRLYAAVSVFV